MLVYVILETKVGKTPAVTPYITHQSARRHYEETAEVYADCRRPFYPFIENDEKTKFVVGDFSCEIFEEELYE